MDKNAATAHVAGDHFATPALQEVFCVSCNEKALVPPSVRDTTVGNGQHPPSLPVHHQVRDSHSRRRRRFNPAIPTRIAVPNRPTLAGSGTGSSTTALKDAFPSSESTVREFLSSPITLMPSLR